MSWDLAIIAAAVLAVAGCSRLLTGTPVTPAMVFVAIGVLAGPLVIGGVSDAAGGSTVRTLAEATLTIVLFGDASRVKLGTLRHQYAVPLRLLGIGLPLTIALGAVLAAALFGELKWVEAAVLGIILAPTDAALGAAVVTEPRLPGRIRQALNVESGLNDGICVPLLLIALAASEAEDNAISGSHAATIVVEAIGFGVLGGVVAGLASAGVLAWGHRRGLIEGAWLQVIPVAGAALAYGFAAPLGGSGFIAAFVAGSLFGRLAGEQAEPASRLNEELGDLLSGVAFLAFGAVLLGPALQHVSWQVAAYAVLSLTVIRMLPVAIAMVGTGASDRTVGFLGWFGPRGLASIVFAVTVVEEARLNGASTILEAAYITIGLSVLLHGLTAAPLADRYARWYESGRPRGAGMETVPVEVQRARGKRVYA
jgi:NhaP-type Na+/H+ or K+/H+ antiporter